MLVSVALTKYFLSLLFSQLLLLMRPMTTTQCFTFDELEFFSIAVYIIFQLFANCACTLFAVTGYMWLVYIILSVNALCNLFAHNLLA